MGLRDLKYTHNEGMRPLRELFEDGARIAKYLNFAIQRGLRAHAAPVEEVALQLMAMSNEVSRGWAALPSPIKNSPIPRLRAADEEKVRRFNALLQPHTWHLELVGWIDKATPVFRDTPTFGTRADLMFRLIELARAGRLDRLRKCETCDLWFFSGTPWGKCCKGGKCRKVKHRSKPESKKKNKIRGREYYRSTLSPYQDLYQKGLSPAEIRELHKRKYRLRGKKHGKKR